MDPRNRIDDYSSPWEDYDPTDIDVLVDVFVEMEDYDDDGGFDPGIG